MYSASQREIGQLDDRVCLEVGAKLLSFHTKGNIGLCFRLSSSLNKVALTEASGTSM